MVTVGFGTLLGATGGEVAGLVVADRWALLVRTVGVLLDGLVGSVRGVWVGVGLALTAPGVAAGGLPRGAPVAVAGDGWTTHSGVTPARLKLKATPRATATTVAAMPTSQAIARARRSLAPR